MCLPSDNAQHELQRWSLINISRKKRLRKPKHKVQLPSVPTSGVASIYPTYCPCSFLLIILKQDFIRSDLAISDCLRRLIHFSDPKVKIWSSESDWIIISLVFMSQCGDTGLMPYRTYLRVRYRYWCRTDLTEGSGTGNTGGVYRRYVSVRTVPNTPLKSSVIGYDRTGITL